MWRAPAAACCPAVCRSGRSATDLPSWCSGTDQRRHRPQRPGPAHPPAAVHAARRLVHRVPHQPPFRHQPGATLRDLADDHAEAIEHQSPAPVHLIGVSTGGSIAQLFAADHPDLVRRLVLVCSAHRLSAYGRRVQRRLAALTVAGQPRRAWAATGPALAATATGGRLFTELMWLSGSRMNPPDPADLLATIDAEDAFDALPNLPHITAPTLVVAGERDR